VPSASCARLLARVGEQASTHDADGLQPCSRERFSETLDDGWRKFARGYLVVWCSFPGDLVLPDLDPRVTVTGVPRQVLGESPRVGGDLAHRYTPAARLDHW
jgi:hypothetical protein